jgi:integrase
MNKPTALQRHIEFKKTSVSSIEKLKDTERYIKKFLDSTPKQMDKIKEEDLVKFINSLDFQIRTKNTIKAYLKVFIKWYYPDWSLKFRNLDRICKQQKPSKAFQPEDMISLEEIKKLIEAEKDLMYKVFWSVFFYGGFRPSECCQLLWDNIFFESQGVIIKLHATKTNRDFYKSLPREVEHLLKEWKKFNSSRWVFPSPLKEDSPIISRTICARLKRLSKKTLNKLVVPYALRHSIATILYKDSKRKDDDTAQQLGHNKSMKQVYLNLDEDTLKANARKLWIKTKPLTPEEKEEFQKLKEEVAQIKEILKKLILKDAKEIYLLNETIKNPKEIDLIEISNKIIDNDKQVKSMGFRR